MKCDTCGADGDEPCRTSGGYVAQQPHAPRYRKGFTLKMQARHLDGKVDKFVSPSDKPRNSMEELNLAMWYVKTMGSVEKARECVEAVAIALEARNKRMPGTPSGPGREIG